MEDKDLQQLFDAKRTSEANRQRQARLAEQLTQLAAGESSLSPKRTRPLWPVWLGAAAASVAVVLFLMPALFGNRQPVGAHDVAWNGENGVVATDESAADRTVDSPEPLAVEPPVRRYAQRTDARPVSPSASEATAEPAPEMVQREVEAVPTVADSHEDAPLPVPTTEEIQPQPTRRIHRRMSNNLVRQSKSERSEFGEMVAQVIQPQTSAADRDGVIFSI